MSWTMAAGGQHGAGSSNWELTDDPQMGHRRSEGKERRERHLAWHGLLKPQSVPAVDIPPPTRPHLLILLRHCELVTKHSNICL